MRKLIFKNHQSPGDILMLTALVRDLHRAHPGRFRTDVRTACPQLWENNPYLTELDEDDAEIIESEYPVIHHSNARPYHFVHGFAQHAETVLGCRIPVTEFKGDIHLSEDERNWMSQVEELGIEDDFWIVVAGGKYDFTAKWWHPDWYQEVVDRFRGRITFVQTGEDGHFHPPLRNVVDLRGKTDIRQFIRLIHHSVGVLCPVTFAMHAAAAVPIRPGRPVNRAAVVIAGGREPPHWEAYPHHRYLAMNGALRCCDNGGCWRSRCTLVGDGDDKDREALCENPVDIAVSRSLEEFAFQPPLRIAKCLHMIGPDQVIRAIESYYEGGALRYNGGD